jgi:GDP-4-dehydro-6-deoxy-D-mannose reductase
MQAGLRPCILAVGDIDLERDFTDVRDVARASALAADQGKSGAVYNIASGEGHTLREVITIMLEAAGVEATIREDPLLVRQGEAPVIIGDAGSLKELTGWEPEISFHQSVIDTLGFWQERVASGTLKENDTI